MKFLGLGLVVLVLVGCSLGRDDVEIASYDVVKEAEDSKIEVRNYPHMILVSAPMRGGENSAFRKLFAYISGENVDSKDIDMTVPVFMDLKNTKAPMMSFVLPDDFTRENTPVPIDGDLVVQEIKDYKVAAIRFSGLLSDGNIAKHRNILEQWIIDNDYVVVGPVKSAGYDAPMTLPMARRNEVLIPVEKR